MPLDTKKLDEMNITRFLYYVSNLLILYNFLTFVVGYRPDEPNYAQQTMYYTLWEMKDMEKRGMDEVRYHTQGKFIIPQVLIEHEMVDSQQGA